MVVKTCKKFDFREVGTVTKMRVLTRSALVKGAMIEWMMFAANSVVTLRLWIWQEFNEAVEGNLANSTNTALEANLHEDKTGVFAS